MDQCKQPAVSLVIPTHQRNDLLRELLLSLDQQTLPREQFEVIVVVDGGNPTTVTMLESLDPPYALSIVPQEQSGASVARNNGAKLATGEVIVFLDDDMLPGEGFLAEHLRMHCTFPRSVVIGSYIPPSLNLVAGQGGWNVWEARVLERHYREVANGERPPAGRRLYSGNFSLRRDDFWHVGGFDESLERGEDVELGFRLERAGLSYHFSHATGALHRGFRTFDSWSRSAYLYGQCDAIFARKRHHVIPEVMGWYRRQPAVARWTVGVCAGRPAMTKFVLRTLQTASDYLTKGGFHRLAHYGYSGIYKLRYWQGFMEELGGKDTFLRQASYWRKRQHEEATSDHAVTRHMQ